MGICWLVSVYVLSRAYEIQYQRGESRKRLWQRKELKIEKVVNSVTLLWFLDTVYLPLVDAFVLSVCSRMLSSNVIEIPGTVYRLQTSHSSSANIPLPVVSSTKDDWSSLLDAADRAFEGSTSRRVYSCNLVVFILFNFGIQKVFAPRHITDWCGRCIQFHKFVSCLFNRTKYITL